MSEDHVFPELSKNLSGRIHSEKLGEGTIRGGTIHWHGNESDAEAFIAEHYRPELVSTDTDSVSLTPSVAIGTTAVLALTEALLITTGQGWWVLPVSLLIAAGCMMFLAILWVQFREIMRTLEAVTAPPRHRSRPTPPKPCVPPDSR